MRTLPLLIVLALAWGCGPKAEAPTQKPEAPKPSAEPAAAPAPPQVPDELKHAAYSYYGLSLAKPIRMRLTTPDGTKSEGEQTVKLLKVENGEAVFSIERTGDLAQLGTDEVTVRKGGVYMTGTTLGTVSGDNLALPADIAPGKTWTSRSDLTQSNGSKLEYTANYRAVGVETVKTPSGSYEALMVRSQGPAKIGEQKVTMTTVSYYVKEVGPVKLVVSTQETGQKPQTITIERIP